MDREAYLRALRLRARRRKQSRFFAMGVMLACAGLLGLLQAAVSAQLFFAIPRPVVDYLENTYAPRFSFAAFREILASTKAEELFLPLAIIYWIYQLCIVLLFVTGVLWFRPLGGRRLGSTAQAILDVRCLIERLAAGSVIRRSERRYLTRLSFRTMAFVNPIPFLPHWYRVPRFQWFNSFRIDPLAKRIIIALTRCDRALAEALQNRLDATPFVVPLQHLENFYFLVARRTDPLLKLSAGFTRTPSPSLSTSTSVELTELVQFTKTATPLILAVRRQRASGITRKPSFVRNAYRLVIAQPIVRHAATLSVVAAFVMLLGTFVFKITAEQAFLTWFTVTFGSLTVSIGITSFRLARGDVVADPKTPASSMTSD